MVRQLQFARVRRELSVAHDAFSTKKPLKVTSADDDEQLKDGYMRLYAFYTPALEAGEYTVSASQVITAYKENEAQMRTLQNQYLGDPVLQGFNVVAPQFSLDPGLINSFYPPAGHQDEGRVLPHVVFNDPHVPWLRDAGTSSWATSPIAGAPVGGPSWAGRSRVPWMALLVFRPEDLQLDATAATALGLASMDAWITGAANGEKPPAEGAYKIKVSEFMGLPSRIKTETGMTDVDIAALNASTDETSIIFPRKTFVMGAFSNGNNTGSNNINVNLAPLNALQLLAHVRHVNTRGMPDADPTAKPESYYSVVVSSMTGDVVESQLATHIVHLVSIENVDATIQAGLNGPSNRIAMISLFSWTYACIPESADFATTMESLATAAQPLRAPDQALSTLSGQISLEPDPAKKAGMTELYHRLKHGYTLSRWRDSVGEESMAFMRGPLVPKHFSGQVDGPRDTVGTSTRAKPLPHLPGGNYWPVTSMTGKNYMIFDKSVGVFDATYAAAWSVGKLMAISDGTFTAALTRLRSRTRTMAMSATLSAANNFTPKKDIIRKATVVVAITHNKIRRAIAGTSEAPVSRLVPAPASEGPKTVHDPAVKLELHTQIASAVQARSLSRAGTVWTGMDDQKSVDADWELVSNWIHDALFLAKMPAHYLFPDPSFLRAYLDPSNPPPDSTKMNPEALRFFSIDETWIDCYIDGALSCSNHLDPQFDTGRLAIKTMINEALATGGAGSSPLPVPRSGFVLRSSAVKVAPDIKITVTRFIQDANKAWIEDTQYDPLLRHTRLDDFTILCLLDLPLDQVCRITMAQPPHQPRFALSGKLVETADPTTKQTITDYRPKLLVKKLYTNETTAEREAAAADPPGSWPKLDDKYQMLDSNEEAGFYHLATRRIAADEIARKVGQKLTDWNSDSGSAAPYTDPVPDSCVVGMQLNDPCYQLVIRGSPPSDAPFRTDARQLWVGPPTTSTAGVKQTTPRDIAVQVLGPLSMQYGTDRPNNGQGQTETELLYKDTKITVPAHNPEHTLPVSRTERLLLNRAAVIPRTTLPLPSANGLAAVQPKSRSPNSWPPADVQDCQFELLLHPDYRQPPPRPAPPYQATGATVYSPQTLLPITPKYLYDLVLAIRRRPGTARPGLLLRTLFIELPIEDATDPRPPTANFWREPLLVGGNYAGTGLAMAGGNQRFVPTLESAANSTDDGQACVRVTLVPRSGSAQGTMPLDDFALSAQASVRVAEVKMPGIVDDTTSAGIATITPTGGTGVANVQCGRCFVKVTEVYADGTEKYSWAVALKTVSADPKAPSA